MTAQASAAASRSDSVAQLRAALGAAAIPVLDRLDWVTRLPNAAAPGFVYLAGACRGWPVGGGGRDLAEAAARLAGETAETLVQTADPIPCDDPADPRIDAAWLAGDAGVRIAAANLTRGRRVGVPAAAVAIAAERPAGAPPTSLGLAAGPDREAARAAALCELIERDAAAAWWLDGAAPRQPDAALAAPAAAELARMRGREGRRATAFLHLPSPTDVPVICALSRDAGGGLAVGLKAAPDPAAAASGAMLELLQMEIALEMARLRQAQGRPSPGDVGPLARAGLDPDAYPAFAARPSARLEPVAASFDALVARLEALGHEVTAADFLPAGGLHVAKVLVPGLRPMPGGGGKARPDAPGARAALM
jgi:thiazole/oxazole-forming peptide maturase SagD family component